MLRWPHSKGSDPDDKNYGMTTLLVTASRAFASQVKPKESGEPATAEVPASQANAGGVDEEIGQILTENPTITGPTLLNLLKAKGFVISKSEVAKEADSASSNAASLRADVKVLPAKKKAKESNKGLTIQTKFLEGTNHGSVDNGIGATQYEVLIIQEGMGNLGDAFYYSKESLKSSVPAFEGKKIYADHPSNSEEQDRPERSVRDIIGHLESVRYEEIEGRGVLKANASLMADKEYEWARGLFRETVAYAKKYPDKDFVGLSINASGEAEEQPLDQVLKASPSLDVKLKLQKAKEEGIETVRVVNRIAEAVSVDLVTEAGAGGRILKMLEQEKHMKMKTKEADGAGHDDAEQDKKLVKSMLDKHVGPDDHSEEVMAQAHEAYQAAVASGMKSEEAGECMGKAMKMAKIMHAAKQSKEAKEAEGKEAKEGEAKESKEGEAEAKEAKFDDKGLHESDKELIKLKGELTALKESMKKREVESHLDAALSATGLPRSVTKKIREGIKNPKSKEEVDSHIGLFMEGYKSGGEAGDVLFISPEKAGEVGTSVSFADCAEE